MSWYFHVPFCRARCGYCDFNTYTATELRGGVSPDSWADAAIAEIRLARDVLAGLAAPAPTVFFGGGTPSLLPPAALGRVLGALRGEFGIAADAEITAEANPDDVTDGLLDGWLAAGVNRVSIGMQSAVPRTLTVLERSHRAADLPAVAARVRRSGMPRMSVDLIYGTPGETPAEWAASLGAALALEPDHVSAYCLGIEDGTKLGARLRAGRIPPVDPDEAAERYEAADEMLERHGYHWYEISNWALPGQECRHNVAYWRGSAWWGAGPGAHSHVAGVRWWNLRHPSPWSAALAAGRSPAAGREVLSDEQRRTEHVMLGIRLASGLPVAALASGPQLVSSWVAQGLARWSGRDPDVFVLTRAGRLLADHLALEALAAAPRDEIAEPGRDSYTGTQASGVPERHPGAAPGGGRWAEHG
jgi:putative oxygen-independent coproporphyrinogen III oxidase